MTDRAVPTIPAGRLVALTAAVMAVHALLLQGGPGLSRPAQRPPERVLAIRLVAPAPLPEPPATATPTPDPSPATAPAAPPSPLPERSDARPGASPEPPARPPASPAAAVVAPLAGNQSGLRTGIGPAPPEPAPTIAIPEPVKLRYEVVLTARGMSTRGKAELWWRHDEREYEARLEITGLPVPVRVQRSTGQLSPQGLAPLRFSEKYRGEHATHFEREKGVLTFSNNSPQLPLAPGTQDRLSVVVQLSGLFAAHPTLHPPGSSITLPVAGTRDAPTWVFNVVGEEDLDLPAARLSGLKLERLPRGEYDVKVELWLAPQVDYAPVRLRLTNPNGDSVDQRWSGTDRG